MNLEIELKNKLKEISKVLDENSEVHDGIGVLAGASGVALFQFYYSKYLNDDTYADKGVDTISKMIAQINDGYTYPTFCSGIAGACWVLELLKEEEFIELDEDFLSEEVDQFLLEAMRIDIAKEDYDFLHGAMGYGYYFLKRYSNSTKEQSKNQYKAYLDELVEAIKKSSKKGTKGVWWEYVLRQDEELKGANLGLSHGMASKINFLSRLAEHKDFKEEVEELIAEATSYILKSKNKNTKLTSTFPNWIIDEEVKDNVSRLAWCYGDPGIGISLLRAGEILQDNSISDEAISILKRTINRKDLEEAVILDAGICHGAYGITQMYTHLYSKTKDERFKEASNFWITEGLKMAFHEDGYAGYKMWQGAKENWKPETNLLEGVAGIGLTILSYLAPFEMKWDECLLIG